MGVQRQAARLLGEHGRELGVDGVDEDGDDGRDAPQHRCAPATEIADGEAERAEQKARVRECDHEAVVPTKRLEELLFLDYCCRHINLRLECRERCERSRVAREPTTVVGGFLAL